MAQTIITPNSIRIFLQDKPEYNSLLDGVRWSDEMINESIINAVDYFNISNPPANNFFTVENFPSRYLLLTGVCGYLLKSASIQQTSNNLTYSADGVQINDNDKGPAFFQMGDQLWKEFKEMSFNWKTNSNVAQCYGTEYSEYINRLYT
jgi:hypothetical protein